MFAGKKLQFYGKSWQDTGKKLKGEVIDMKILGNGSIFVETFRKREIRGADFEESESNSNEFFDIPGEGNLNFGMENKETGEGG